MRFLTVLCLMLVLALPARAQTDEIRGVITSQLQAFQKDDFATAFTFASPMIKQMFGNPERFGTMVQQGYPMVWRPADVKFGGLNTFEGRTVQTVFFTDQGGQVFEASYEMIETGAGWQINGVTLKKAGLGA